jgi:hypothetical protein
MLALIVGVAVYLGYRKLMSFRDQYTESKPLVLPATRYSAAELGAVQKRIDQFLALARAEHTNARLALSANDLNALIATSGFSNRAYVTFTSNAVVGQFSVPLGDLGMRFLSGRYLNGSGVLNVGCINGHLNIGVKELAVNGLKLPEHYMNVIRQQNFAQGMATNAPVIQSLEHVGRVAVENDHLLLEVGTQPVR